MSDITRALRLRCPHCGQGKIYASFLHMKTACANCRLIFNRGEHDYFLGAYMLNLIGAELIVTIAIVIGIVLAWPNVPWDKLMFGLVPLALLTPLLTYRYSHALWLAIDLRFRPAEDSDFAARP